MMTALETIQYAAAQRPTIVTPAWRFHMLEGLVLFAAAFASQNGKPLSHCISCGDMSYEAVIYPPGTDLNAMEGEG